MRVSFKTIGCRLNQAETGQMAARFEASGCEIAQFGEACDVCVIHTCAVTAKADKDCIRLARSVKRSDPGAIVVLAGCAVEVDADRMRRESGADVVLGQGRKFDVAALLSEIRRARGYQQLTTNNPQPAAHNPQTPIFETTRALVKAQDGCDFHCAYCIVPTARGKPRSRPQGEILEEVRQLADRGFKEIVLTGANLGCYGDGARSLVDLLVEIETVEGIQRIRLSSIELSTTERAIIDFMSSSEKLCRHIHLPLQSGDDHILAQMSRRYTSGQYMDLIQYAVNKIPLLGLGADILVGFPGEDDRAFQNTAKLVEQLPFSNLHVFSYSKRHGTKAAEMPDQVPEAEKKRRSAAIIELGKTKKSAFAKKFLGCEVAVLIEKVADGNAVGWTGEYVESRIVSKNLKPNQIVQFKPDRCSRGVVFAAKVVA